MINRRAFLTGASAAALTVGIGYRVVVSVPPPASMAGTLSISADGGATFEEISKVSNFTLTPERLLDIGERWNGLGYAGKRRDYGCSVGASK